MAPSVDELKAAIAPILDRYPAIEAAYLFGSHARGTAHADSDLDLALVGDAPALGAIKLDVLADLTSAGFDRVDLVCLDDSDLVLAFEAVSVNCPIFRRARFDHGSYFSRVLREYFDFEPYLRIHREALKERLLRNEH
jgi:hypothetical protein